MNDDSKHTFLCIYCANYKGEKEFTLEHIWPQKLGGSSLHGIWRTNSVCKACNNSCGLHVDGAFLRSMLVNMEEVTAGRAPAGFPRDQSKLIPEGWLSEFHVMADYDLNVLCLRPDNEPDGFDSYLGGFPNRRGRKQMLVYLFFTRHENVIEGVKAAKARWPEAIKIFANPIVDMDPIFLAQLSRFRLLDLQGEDAFANDFIKANQIGGKVHSQPVIQIDFDRRFMAKIALALACAIKGDDYTLTPGGSELRSLLWERNHQSRNNSSVKGKLYLETGMEDISKIFTDNQSWHLYLAASANTVFLIIITPLGRIMSIQVLESVSEYFVEGLSIADGVIWSVGDATQTTACSLADFIAASSSGSRQR